MQTLWNHSTCFPNAQARWEPEAWLADDVQPRLPADVTTRQLERACDGITVHVAFESWIPLIRRSFSSKYAAPFLLLGSNEANASVIAERHERRARCIASLRSFRPKVCALRNVMVWGHARRLMSADGGEYYMPPVVQDAQRAHDLACPANCRARPANVVSCGGHAVIGRNLMGVAYFHSLFEMLGSVVFALDILRAPNTRGGANADRTGVGVHRGADPVRLLENMCIPADGSQSYMNMRSRQCAAGGLFGVGPNAFVAAMLGLLGVDVPRQLQHYPYVRQWDGPAIHLDRATFDCSAGNYRNFWHMLKLRHVMHQRLAKGVHNGAIIRAANRALVHHHPLDTVVLMDRNECDGASLTANKTVQRAHCHKGRGVKQHQAIRAALEARFMREDLQVVNFVGNEPYAQQAHTFYRAAFVVGPHGAQLANMVFCQRRAIVIEFIAAHRTNSALYAGYASSVFGLDYWTVVSESPNGSYDDIDAPRVVKVIELALERQRLNSEGTGSVDRGRARGEGEQARDADGGAQAGSKRDWHVLQGREESNLVTGYGEYVNGWPAGW
jgi:hypothetical protein